MKAVYKLELRWNLLLYSFTDLDVIDCNSEELRHIWVCLNMKGLIWVLQQWAFIKYWFGFENNQAGTGRNSF